MPAAPSATSATALSAPSYISSGTASPPPVSSSYIHASSSTTAKVTAPVSSAPKYTDLKQASKTATDLKQASKSAETTNPFGGQDDLDDFLTVKAPANLLVQKEEIPSQFTPKFSLSNPFSESTAQGFHIFIHIFN